MYSVTVMRRNALERGVGSDLGGAENERVALDEGRYTSRVSETE